MSLRVAFLLAILTAVATASPVVPLPAPLPVPVRLTVQPGDLLRLRDAGNANDYVDMVLANLNALMPAKVPLPDLGTMFNIKKCYMFGLENGMRRSGDATMITIEKTVKFTSAIKSGKVGISCHWHFMLLGGKASGTSEVIDVSSGVEIEMTSGSSPALTEFRVTEVADIKTDITGLTFLFNWIAEDITDIIVNSFKVEMVAVVEGVVKNLFQQVLDLIVFP